MKILLLGGTGAMGNHLANCLSDSGHKVVVTSRSKRNDGKVEFRQGNAKNNDFLMAILSEQWDAIVDFMTYSVEHFSNRMELLLSSTSQYVFLSSSRVYNESQEALTEESTRLLDSTIDQEFLGTSEYSLSKARQEDMLRSSNKKNWTIVRPYITYSEKRLQLGTLEKESWLYRALHGRTIVLSKDIDKHLTTLTYGLDVATGIASLIQNKKAFGETYHITNEVSIKWSDVLEIYLEVLENRLGYRPKVIYQNLSEYLTWNPGRYQVIYDRLFDRKFDNIEINKFISTKEFTDVNIGLRKCVNDFINNPEFLKIDWEKEAVKDKYTKEITSLKEIDGFKQKLIYLNYRFFK